MVASSGNQGVYVIRLPLNRSWDCVPNCGICK